MRARLVIVALLSAHGLWASTSWAQSAQDELERQLREMVGKPPTKLLIEYEGLDQPNYKLVEVVFDLDGSSLPTPKLEKLNGEGKHLVFHGDVKPGKHALEVTVVLTDVAGALFSYEAGFKWKVKKAISFEQQPGLEVQILVIPEMDPAEKDAKKKFTLKSTAQVKMLSKLEDGTMPDAPKPNIAAPKEEPVDAGSVATSAVVTELSAAEKAKILKDQQAEEARAKKQAALDAAQKKKDDAAAAKAAKAEAAKQKLADAAAAKAAKAEAAKQKLADAAAAKAAAAEEAKRKREEAAAEAKRKKDEAAAAKLAKANPEPKPVEPVAANDPKPIAEPKPGEPKPTAEPKPVDPIAADTAPAPAVVDAGAPTIAVAEPPKKADPPKPPAQPESEGGGGLPLPILAGIGVAALGIIIFLVTRKKSS